MKKLVGSENVEYRSGHNLDITFEVYAYVIS